MSKRKPLTIACQHNCGEMLNNADENAIRYTCGLCLLRGEPPPSMASESELLLNAEFKDIGALTEAMLPEEFDAASRAAASLNVSLVLLTTPHGTRVWVEAAGTPTTKPREPLVILSGGRRP